jgi:LemA protein
MTVLITVGAVALFLIFYVIFVFNKLVILRNRSNEAWAQIDVQLKLRSDLIPNLVETVKGYAAHERTVLEDVTKARAMIQDAGGDISKTMDANNALAGALKSLFAVVENYPQLKADQNFMNLQQELSGIEGKIAYARQFYNECVRYYNQYQQEFPAAMFATMFGHKQNAYFEITEEDRKKPEVKF